METESSVPGLAALSLVQGLIDELTTAGILSKEQRRAIVDRVISFHENAGPDGAFSEGNEQVAMLVRAVFRREV